MAFAQAFLEYAPPVDDAAEPVVERREDGANGGEKEHRRHGELNDAGDVGYVFHPGLAMTGSGDALTGAGMPGLASALRHPAKTADRHLRGNAGASTPC